MENETLVQQRSEQMEIRIQKLKALQERGLNPYGQRYERTHQLQEITDFFAELENQQVKICGRLFSKRDQGKACFANLMDQTGNIQIYSKIDLL